MDNWKQRRYVQWALIVPFALFGYFVPYVHVVLFRNFRIFFATKLDF